MCIRDRHITSGLTTQFQVNVIDEDGVVIPDDISTSNLYKSGGRYFYIPHSNLAGRGNTGQMEEMLESRSVDGYEDFNQNCVLLSGTPNDHTVYDIGYKEYKDGTVYYRPIVELIRRSKVVTIFTHGTPCLLYTSRCV